MPWGPGRGCHRWSQGRKQIALAFNRAVSEGRISAPVVLSRDHHDVSGTDSPYRETTSIEDGSRFCAGAWLEPMTGMRPGRRGGRRF